MTQPGIAALSRLTLFVGLGLSCMAVEEGAASGRAPDRYLLVVDISSAMKRCDEGTLKAVSDLLSSGMKGELREGDQLGVWTYSNELLTGEVPIQVWSEQAKEEIERLVVGFLASRKYGRKTEFDEVLAGIKAVAGSSHRLTVILISDGDETLEGTPFEHVIAQYFQTNKKPMEKARSPFITILRAVDGAFVGYTQTYDPWPVRFPSFPAEPDVQPESEVAMQEDAAARDIIETAPVRLRPMRMGEPLIVSGRKESSPESLPVATPLPARTAPSATPARVQSAPSTSSSRAAPLGTVKPIVAANPRPATATINRSVSPLPLARTTEAVAQPAPLRSNAPAPSPEPTNIVALPEATPRGFLSVWAILAVILSVGLALTVVLRSSQRSRARGHTSLITRSMDSRGER